MVRCGRDGRGTWSLLRHSDAINSRQQGQQSQSFRTIARAVAAAGTEDLAELLRINRELVQDALALARRLVRTRIVAGSMHRELRKLAGVPIAHALAVLRVPFIHDIEAMTRGAVVGTGPATQTGQSFLLPIRAGEMLVHELLDVCRAELRLGPLYQRRNLIGCL